MMTKTPSPLRPATSAIAAFLVLTAPAALAQTEPTESAPPAAEPAAPLPMQSPVAIPVPQTAEPAAPTPVIRVPLDIAPPASEPASKAAAPQTAAATPPRVERSTPPASMVRRAAPIAAEPAVAEQAAAELAKGAEIAAPAPLAVPAPPIADPATPVVAERAEAGDAGFPWEIAGGAAALLIAGGAAFAFARRRRADAAAPDAPAPMRHDIAPVPPIDPAVVRAQTEHPAPVPTSAPTPAFAAAHGNMGRHEAMAFAGPTPENPFLTLKKRLKRARFHDRRARLEYDALLAGQKDMRRQPVSAWDIAQRPAPAADAQTVHRPDGGHPRAGLRPGVARG